MSSQCHVKTGTILGVTAHPVDVEVEVGAGLPSFSIVGLPDTAVQEARERVRSALRSSGFAVPNARIVINLAPGPLRKHGTGFDLPIAMGILGATGQLPRHALAHRYAVGELSLDGHLRAIPGMLAHALAAQRLRLPLVGPLSDGQVPALDGLELHHLTHLSGLGHPPSPPPDTGGPADHGPSTCVDFAEVNGQQLAVRALQIAAAGAHNVLLVGPPGTGKTMLARRLPTILPPLSADEQVETALIHSVAGALTDVGRRPDERPFRAPHHTASTAGLIGGGSPPQPGEASLAHNGVLFLDELPEFSSAALQSLRQPMEDGSVTLVRADGRITFPARFSLIAAANPCPCGHLGDAESECSCPPSAVERYRARIGGPLMDRIDIVCHVSRPGARTLLTRSDAESSVRLRERVLEARARAQTASGMTSSILAGGSLIAACRLDDESLAFVERAARNHRLSGRSITRLLRVARTVGHLNRRDRVGVEELCEALAFRGTEVR